MNEEKMTEETAPEELRSIRDIIKDLSKPVAKRHLRTRKQGNQQIEYISWYDAVKYLDHYAPGWCYEIRRVDSIGGKLILTIRLSVPCLEGVIYRAESMALRRAAAKFGLGLSLYEK
jgi:hypothetical protein